MAVPEFLRGRLALPVIGSPMFIISSPQLVVTQCCSGIVGAFPAANARLPETLDGWLRQITAALAAWDAEHPDRQAAPYAVNLIVHRSNGRLLADLETCVKHKVPIIITSLGAREDVNDAVHGYGGIVLHDVINNKFAHKAVEKGADGLIAVAAGAGGHAGTISPFALLQEIRAWFSGPLALSGAIASGGAILAARAAGADLAYIGSAFIATEEANAAAGYKQAIIDSGAEDIIYSSKFTGVHGNYLRASIINSGLDPDQLQVDGDGVVKIGITAKVWKDIWGAGQGIGAVKEVVPAAAFIERLKREYSEALEKLHCKQGY